MEITRTCSPLAHLPFRRYGYPKTRVGRYSVTRRQIFTASAMVEQ